MRELNTEYKIEWKKKNRQKYTKFSYSTDMVDTHAFSFNTENVQK